MMHPDDALALIDALSIQLPSETVELARALGRVPEEAPVALQDQPPFDKSAMDGFAYRSADGALADSGDSFPVREIVAAGCARARALEPGECVQIMTGAPMPEGTTAVQRIEWTQPDGDRVRFTKKDEAVSVVKRGENRKTGESLFERRLLKAQDIGILASNGMAALEVVKKPRVMVISTGDELCQAGRALPPGAIYDSNGPQLVAQVMSAGFEASFAGIHRDDEDALAVAIAAANVDAELIIVSGGVSAGLYDHVPRAMERAGFSMVFHGLAMKPGKPTWFGRKGDRFAFGMPGNPVSTFVNFEVLAKPLLWRFLGLLHRPTVIRIRLVRALRRQGADMERVEFLPVHLSSGTGTPVAYRGSTMLDALALTDAFVRLEIGQREHCAGSEVDARLV